MKTVNIRDLQSRLKDCVDTSQGEPVVVTRHGKPAAVIVGVEGKDWETVVRETSKEHWEMVRERRAEEKTIPLAAVRELSDLAGD